MIVLSLFIFFESMAAGFVNTVENKGNTSGSAGIIMAIGFLATGIVYIVTRKKNGLGGDIANAIILGLFGIVGLANSDKVYQDLLVWIILGFIIGFGFLIWHIIANKISSNSSIKHQSQVNNYSSNQGSNSMPTRAQYRQRRNHK